ncbi:S8 family serine peptidase [Clostridioides sp. ES-S-0001-02]|uniref:S8 family serine peptidase n=1 Tax=Clostridioides sp. ES-S-0001-02 TaxID=2770770 RepID=UPI001D10ABF4|nr:S8 family serine peptidase [Clostridioides sp. ES-S-0001-02]
MPNQKKTKVAVIDSGVDIRNSFFKDKDIVCLKVEEDKVVECNTDTNGHGTLVVSYILRECENVDIISIQILNEENHSSLDKLIQSINYCIKNKIDIINLSLGIHIRSNKIEELKLVCNKAVSNGILIFAAHSNVGKVSYPANLKNVIGIGYDKRIKGDIFKIDKYKMDIIFSTSLLSMNHFGISASKSGSSFLCPYIVGVFCRYIYYYKIDIQKENIYYLFLNFINLLNSQYKYKIFNLFPNDLKNKKVLFYPNNKTNQNIVETYSSIFSSLKFYSPTNKNYDFIYSDLDKHIENIDLIAIGNIDYQKDRIHVQSLIQAIKHYDIDILVRYPFVSTFDRYILSKETGKNVYCQHL